MNPIRTQSSLHDELRQAARRNELSLLFQPCIELDSGRIVSTEALLRWHHPSRGIIPPDLFIPLAEAHGSIMDIGKWVLWNACAQARQWHDAGLTRMRMAVNVSTVQLEDPAFVQDVIDVLDRTGLDARFLEIEITETAFIRDIGAVAGALRALKRVGAAISMDDFGVGYSRLARLWQLPVDILKIDKSFIGDATIGQHGRAVVRTLIHLAKMLELTVVAEGVETQSQLQFLREQQCDRVQGFLVSRPIAPDKVFSLMTAAKCPLQMPALHTTNGHAPMNHNRHRSRISAAWHSKLAM